PLIFIFIFAFCFKTKAHTTLSKVDTIYFSINENEFQKAFSNNLQINDKRPNPILHWLTKKQKKNKRIMAAVLAFPFPFGIVGLHRIYLGTAPYVPVVYIASLGGIFGILPFIDFCVIVLDKDFDRYNNNKKVFMWIND
ncbi:MAG: TM2 domain-containing protein, partial [Bacteroidia bacterium]|nr:TM2 domain-containing protein [Bacteroidia bacterium]